MGLLAFTGILSLDGSRLLHRKTQRLESGYFARIRTPSSKLSSRTFLGENQADGALG